MGLFDLSTPGAEHTNRMIGKTETSLLHFQGIETANVANIREHIPVLPGPEEAVFIWTIKQFTTMSFIAWMIESVGPIDELTISTYSIGNTTINTLMRYYDNGDIREGHIYLAAYAKRIASKKVDQLRAQIGVRDRLSLSFGFNHSKIVAAKIGSTGYFTVCGSGNFSENANNEQFVLVNSKQVYNFYKNIIRNDPTDRYRQD